MKKSVLVNQQWQGGGNLDPYYGACKMADYVMQKSKPYMVPAREDSSLAMKKGIIGLDVIREQTGYASTYFKVFKPDQILLLGGSCDADLASVAYMNRRAKGRLTVVWMDAHGDLNTPDESASHLFYGMPLRALLGECPPMADFVPLPLRLDQVIHVGGRDLEPSEEAYLQRSGITVCGPEAKAEEVLRCIQDREPNPVYVHLDLDVMDPEEFPDTPLPVPGGMSYQTVRDVLQEIKRQGILAGLGIFEYKPSKEGNPLLEELMDIGLE